MLTACYDISTLLLILRAVYCSDEWEVILMKQLREYMQKEWLRKFAFC